MKKVMPAGRQGFTFIELLVVISIIGVLASLVLVNFNAARERTRDVQRKSDLDQVKKALRMYYNDNNFYPAANLVAWGSSFQSGTMVYMKILPHDPSYQAADQLPEYNYELVVSGAQDFCLWASLENASDGDIVKSEARCSSCGRAMPDYVVCAD